MTNKQKLESLNRLISAAEEVEKAVGGLKRATSKFKKADTTGLYAGGKQLIQEAARLDKLQSTLNAAAGLDVACELQRLRSEVLRLQSAVREDNALIYQLRAENTALVGWAANAPEVPADPAMREWCSHPQGSGWLRNYRMWLTAKK